MHVRPPSCCAAVFYSVDRSSHFRRDRADPAGEGAARDGTAVWCPPGRSYALKINVANDFCSSSCVWKRQSQHCCHQLLITYELKFMGRFVEKMFVDNYSTLACAEESVEHSRTVGKINL